PDKLTKASIQHFLQEKERGIQSSLMLQPLDENNLHTLRRLLKDLLHTWPYTRHEAVDILPYEINSSAKLQKLAELLGNYGDQCTALDFLQPGYIEGVQQPQGRELLRNLCAQLELRKKQFRLDFFSTLLKQRQKPALLALE
ncbi:MAG TPA: hypothetical protein VHL77_10870, partial [Ferruginibacter sp.]|nr:hypothetical protein [Ferruginibacter sp.]